MIEVIIALLLAVFGNPAPGATERRIEPIPEPIVIDDRFFVYLPDVRKEYPEIEGADNLRPVYGYASPHRRTYDVPFYNWRAIPEDCANPNFWPMVRGQPVDPGMVEACDNGTRWLLIYNEPELGHYPATPEEAALFVRDWADRWSGPIACCGNFYHVSVDDDGLEWFLDFMEASADDPPIDAIHLHVYAWLEVDVDRLYMWRTVADLYGWPIHVTESGVFTSPTYPPEEVAAALPGFLGTLEDVFGTRLLTLMWFSDYLQPWVLGGPTAWHNFNLTTIDGALTVVGVAWREWIERP